VQLQTTTNQPNRGNRKQNQIHQTCASSTREGLQQSNNTKSSIRKDLNSKQHLKTGTKHTLASRLCNSKPPPANQIDEIAKQNQIHQTCANQ